MRGAISSLVVNQGPGIGPTQVAPQPASMPPVAPHPAPPRPHSRGSRGLHPALVVVLVLLALGVGGIIGALVMSRMSDDEGTEAGAPPEAVVASMGRLEVTSKPEGGTVVVDGRLVGLTPIERIDLDPGRHAVVIDAFGYQPYAGTITIVENGKPRARDLLVFIAEELQATLPIATIDVYSKASAGKPLEGDEAKVIAARSHLIITGVGD